MTRPAFPKPTFTAFEMIAAIGELFPKLPRLAQALAGETRLDPRLREVVLLAVAEALECRYCRAAHSELARGAGVGEEEIAAVRGREWADLQPRERAAVVSALRRIGAGGAVDASIDVAPQEHFSPEEVGRLATLVDAVRIAGLAGNTVDMLLSRLSGAVRPRRDSSVASEAAVAALWAAGAVPIGLGIAAAGAWRRLARR